jgi:hypothetical protein
MIKILTPIFVLSFLVINILYIPHAFSKLSSSQANRHSKLKFFDSQEFQMNNDYIKNPHPSRKGLPKSVSGIIKDIKKTHRDLDHTILR